MCPKKVLLIKSLNSYIVQFAFFGLLLVPLVRLPDTVVCAPFNEAKINIDLFMYLTSVGSIFSTVIHLLYHIKAVFSSLRKR